jgi:hypothetical protein
MTLGPNKEPIMTAKIDVPDEYDADRFRIELAHQIERFIANSEQLWATCENTACRRAKRCAGQDCECVAKWSAALPPLSPEQERALLIDFKKALGVRIGFGTDSFTAEQLAEAISKEKAARAAMPQESGMQAPVAKGTKLAPEQQERIDRALNDYLTEVEQPERDPAPRITQL